MFKAIKDYFCDLHLNFNFEFLTFLLHRITGVALTLYLFMHIYTLSPAIKGSYFFNASVGAYDNLFGHIIEWLLLGAVALHTLNGIRIIIGDFFLKTKKQKTMMAYGFVILLVVMGVSIKFFF